MNFTKDQMLEMYNDLVFTRCLGDKIVENIYSGKISGAIHPSLGQEAISAGHMFVKKERGNCPQTIWTTVTHRMQGVMAEYLGLNSLLAEMLNKVSGNSGGISGEYHVADMSARLLPAQGVLGGSWPTAVGIAWALKAQGKKDNIVFACYGDGACSEGATWEAMNFAALHKLPIVFVIENNGVAMSTPLADQSPIEELALRAKASGMKGVTIDGNDVLAVVEGLMTSAALAAQNEPNVIEFKTWRWEGHFVGDDQTKYRSIKFRDNLDEIDPVLRFQKTMIENGYIDDAYIKKTYDEKLKLIGDGFAKAIADEYPAESEVLSYNRVYSNNTGGAI